MSPQILLHTDLYGQPVKKNETHKTWYERKGLIAAIRDGQFLRVRMTDWSRSTGPDRDINDKQKYASPGLPSSHMETSAGTNLSSCRVNLQECCTYLSCKLGMFARSTFALPNMCTRTLWEMVLKFSSKLTALHSTHTKSVDIQWIQQVKGNVCVRLCVCVFFINI